MISLISPTKKTLSLGRKRTFTYIFRAQETCPGAANVVLYLLSEIYKLKQGWLCLNVLLRDYFLLFISGSVLTPETPR